jgi:hypothetical protein
MEEEDRVISTIGSMKAFFIQSRRERKRDVGERIA